MFVCARVTMTNGHYLYRIAGNFEGENLCKVCGFVAIRESFLHKVWRRGIRWHGEREQYVKSFLPQQFLPLYGTSAAPAYALAYAHCLTFNTEISKAPEHKFVWLLIYQCHSN